MFNNLFLNTYLQIIYQSRIETYYDRLVQAKKNNQLLYMPEEAKQLSQILLKYNNIRKQKMVLWFLVKGTMPLPLNQSYIDQIYQIVQKKKLDFQKYNSPLEIINNNQDLSSKRLTAKLNYNPDNEPMFSNKKQLRNGVVVYNVDDSKQGQLAVRRAIDYNWGYQANPWCLAARPKNYIKNNIEKIQNATQQQRYQLLYGDEVLEKAWKLWSELYIAYPKRIAFQNGQLLAFCATQQQQNMDYTECDDSQLYSYLNWDIGLEITWWDRNDHPASNIPGLKNEDDPEWYNFQYNNYGILKDSNISLEVLNKLVDDKNYKIKIFLAKNPNLPKEILYKLANDENYIIRAAVATNSNLPIEILNKLVTDKNIAVLYTLAQNLNTPPIILAKLAEINDQYLQERIAIHKNTPVEILYKLSHKKSQLIRSFVVSNPNTPIEILIKLASDKSYQVRLSIAQNIKTPKEILNKLINDEDYFVRSAAKQTLNK